MAITRPRSGDAGSTSTSPTTSASAVVRADQIVYFVNGKAMTVKAVEKGERFTTLEMEGGGRIGVPTDQIVRIEEYQVSAGVAAPAAGDKKAAEPKKEAKK